MKKGDIARVMGAAKKAASKTASTPAVLPLHKDYKPSEKDPKLQKTYERILASNRSRLASGKSNLHKGQKDQEGKKDANIFGRVFGPTQKEADKKKSAESKKNGKSVYAKK